MAPSKGQSFFERFWRVFVCQGEALRDFEQWVEASSRGDKRAFGQLVDRFQKRVFYTILKVVRDVHAADDLTQEVFVKAFCSLHKLRTASLFPTWIHRIAMNKAIDHHRRRKKEGETVFLVDDFFGASRSVPLGDGQGEGQLQQLREGFHEAVDALPEGQRLVLMMTMDQGLSQEEIAAVLGIPVGTVKSRLFHARKFLGVRLREYL